MDENKEKAKQLAKAGAQAWLKAAMTPVKAAITSALLTILPYVLIGVVILVLVFCVYFGVSEQIDTIMNETEEKSEELGERMGNALSLHGFRTIESVEETEEYKYFFMLDLYKELFRFDDYELSLLNQTLLFEGNNEERFYLSEGNSMLDDGDKNNDELNFENPLSAVWNFVKNIATNYQVGFLNAYAGKSQYLKANKNMLVNAVALKKCKILTEGTNYDLTQCYKGYLLAEYNIYKDFLIDDGKFESDVEEGYLVLGENNFFEEAAGGLIAASQDFRKVTNEIVENFTRWTIWGGVIKKFNEMEMYSSTALIISLFGELADDETEHYFYDGYITENLKEEYKVAKNDDDIENDEIQKKEQDNRNYIADLIIDEVGVFYELNYGPNNVIESKLANVVASNETKVGVVIDEDGNTISFDDYVMMDVLANYSDEVKQIVESGTNVEEKLRALTIIARSEIYVDTGYKRTMAEITGDTDIYSSGKEIYDEWLNDSTLAGYIFKVKNSISTSRGKVVKIDGSVVEITDDQITQIIDSISSDKNFNDTLSEVIPGANTNVTVSPLQEGTYYISSYYGENREAETHDAIDYAASNGTLVSAIIDGVVVDTVNSCDNNGWYGSECGGGFGNRVIVQYEDYYVIYAHLYPGSVDVNVGDSIIAGQSIGQVGNSGSSTGSHLHLEVRIGSWEKGAPTENPNMLING